MRRSTLTTSLFAVAAASLPSIALAAGGLFPQGGGTSLAPVDLAAERVVFEVGDGQVTAHFQLHYHGSADDFAWIIPLPSVPTVAESSIDMIRDLDMASHLEVQLAPEGACVLGDQLPETEHSGCSCGGTDDVAQKPRPLPGNHSEMPPVTVYASSLTANYTYDVVQSAATSALIDWLNDHGYHLGERMTPVLERYNRAGTKFLAIRLQQGRSAEDVVPIAVTYAAEKPSLALELSAIAASAHLSLLVMILADEIYIPENYVATPPKAAEILVDEDGNTSYFDWVARASSEAKGRFFATEYLAELPESQRGAHTQRYLSRYYTRISPEQMTLDPIFRPHPVQTMRVQPLIDLSQEESLFDCETIAADRVPVACAFNYCGEGSLCTVVEGAAACACAAGTVAQQTMGPEGRARVSCVPSENPVGLTVAELGFDACAGVSCGMGTCTTKGGSATCACGAGAIARLVDGAVSCELAPTDMIGYGPGGGRESRSLGAVTTALHRPRGAPASLFAALVLAVLLRRRR